LGAQGGEAERAACYQAGMDGYIEKPPSRDELKIYLRAALEKESDRRAVAEPSAERDRPRDWREAEVLDLASWQEEADLHRRLVRRFVAEGAAALRKLAAGEVQERSFELTLHAFKGSADAVGAARLAGVCSEA